MKKNYLSKEELKYFSILFQLEIDLNFFNSLWYGRMLNVLGLYFIVIKYLLLKKEKINLKFDFQELLNYYNLLIKEDCLSNSDKIYFENLFEILKYDINSKKFLESADFNFIEEYFNHVKIYFTYLNNSHISYLEKIINNQKRKKEYISAELIYNIKNHPKNINKDTNLIELYLYFIKYKLLKNNYQMDEKFESFKDFLLELQNMVSENILNKKEKQCIESFLHYIGFCNEFNLKKLIGYNQKSIIYLEEEEINTLANNYFLKGISETRKMLLESNKIIDYLIIEENIKNF